MGKIGLSKYIKLETLKEIAYPKLKEKPSHENNVEALNEVFN